LVFEKTAKHILSFIIIYIIFAVRIYRLASMKNTVVSIWNFYIDGFKNMTWGRTLWLLILLKVIILFFLLRLFFFQPVLAGKSEEQKIEHVGEQLVKPFKDVNQ